MGALWLLAGIGIAISPEAIPNSAIALSVACSSGPRSAAQASRFAQALRDLTADQNGLLLDRLRPQGGAVEFPLGWTLSSATWEEMDKQISALKGSTTGPVAELFQRLSRKPIPDSR